MNTYRLTYDLSVRATGFLLDVSFTGDEGLSDEALNSIAINRIKAFLPEALTLYLTPDEIVVI